ncbi:MULTISPECIES: hypothetical protein [Arcobacter]|jgi:hypothetical protein|uniref:Uncharacterized protein n=1 Tax=Arcobacter ellisii TaxID=913109 RepID=A0ABM6YPV9_9BACT|nr:MULTISPECIES: hypothetical protein [Arcobacter]AXX96318.1 hypothetical protein AELL_2714 [Arcobacter ellisii]MBD3830201.1 hypothetical protein [Arcobacter sp.]MDD3008221.1 hypothetical protein [Arcobacter sp.]MDY3203784.1 hypothetical protein [Arcobacter sp.]
MIFIGLFLIIAIVVISLNIHNHSNLDKIEEYLNSTNCKEYIYSRGSYKALCEDSLVEIENSFVVDVNKNLKTIKYKDIKNIDTKETKLMVDDFVFEFKDKNDLNLFLEKLKGKL